MWRHLCIILSGIELNEETGVREAQTYITQKAKCFSPFSLIYDHFSCTFSLTNISFWSSSIVININAVVRVCCLGSNNQIESNGLLITRNQQEFVSTGAIMLTKLLAVVNGLHY